MTGPITATGKGVTLNKWGGQQLVSDTPARGGQVKTALTSGVLSLDLCQNTSFDTKQVGLLVHDTLMSTTKDGSVEPELAKSMTTDDKGLTWTMALPSGVKFTDGTGFDAAAVVANTKRCKAAGQSTLKTLESVTALDTTTVEFRLSQPWTGFDEIFAPSGGSSGAPGMIASPAAVKKYGDKYGLHPVGVGPYQVTSFRPGGDIALKANPDYRVEGQPYLSSIDFTPMTDSDARLAAVRSGDIDFALSQVPTDFPEAEKAGLRVLRQPAVTYYDIVMNLSRQPFDSPAFRKAVTQAIDLKSLSAAVFQNMAAPTSGLVPPGSPDHVKTGWPAYDPKEAKAAVAELKNQGKRTDFTLVSTAPPEFQKQSQIMQQMLRDVGIEMRLEVAEQPSLISAVQSGAFEAQLRYTSVPANPLQIFSTAYGSTSPANLTKSGDADLDALLAKGRTATEEERRPILQKIQARLTTWSPVIPLLQQSVAYLVGDRVAGFGGTIPQTQWWDGRTVWVRK
ncbi:ABC transporter substrate-binding protein [Streptomyces sp. NPDC058221]|uniref:ABC transporter substrate-binding protein n=1 Tax=Streptomyces sp. NPDC058221 TaxID=3346388 RepID=UPI0036E09C3B